jgi:hypothetical protein
MLVKVVLVFLLAMVALGMIARALGLGGRTGPRRISATLCPRCGRLTGAEGRCDCRDAPRA